MKKKIWILVIGLLLIGTNLYAGNLTVSGKVGIGTTSPGEQLDVLGNMQIQKTNINSRFGFVMRNPNGFATIYSGGTLGNGLGFYINNDALANVRMVINSDGNVGIGTPDPLYTLHVNGYTYSVGYYGGSDIRWKKNIMPLNTTLDKILKLKGVNYEWRKDEFKAINFSEGKQIGLIAQEVEKVFPELVRTANDGYKAISYERLSVLLMKAIQEIAGAVDITNATAAPSIQSFYQGTTPALIIGKEGNIDIQGNIKTSGSISTGSISAKEFKTASGDVSISQSGDITVKNITSGDITTTGKITASGELSAGNIKSSGGIAANGNIVQTSPDLNSYGIAMERTDESSQYHNWTFWHMNDKTNNKNGLEIWEYKANSKSEACTATGITCNPRIVLKEGGNVGIGSDPGNYKLYVDGDLSVNGDTYSKGGQWLLLSDMRVKENIATIESPLTKILNMDGVSFNWKKDEFKGQSIPAGIHYGLIAQQIEKVLPEVVKEDPTGKKNVVYTEIIPVLIEAMKEQQKVIDMLKDRINKLEKGG